jgi:HSP20 family protein
MRTLLPSLWSGDFQSVADPLSSFRRDMQEMFGSLERRLPYLSGDGAMASFPTMDMSETKDSVELMAELPGVSDKDVSVTLDRDRLIISGEKKKEIERKDQNWHYLERNFGSFHRTIPLNFEPDANAVDARFEKGILHVTVKKPAEIAAKAKTIPVRTGGN